MRRMLVALATVALLGCGGDSTGVNANVAGAWGLQTVNGSPLPFTVAYVASPLYRFEVLSDRVDAAANGSYTETFTVRETNGTSVTTTSDSDFGTWVQNGSAVTITSSDGTQSSGTISGNTLTVNQEGLVLAYKRL